MIIADQIKNRSIAEYLLYMWQIEDLMRAFNLDTDRVNSEIVDKFQGLTDDDRNATREWFDNIVKMMELEHLRQGGHLQINKNTIIRLVDLHLELLKSEKYPEYGAEFYKTLPYIVELRTKAGDNQVGEIETCFNALYLTMTMRLQKREISEGTQAAVAQISKFLATLSKFYKMNEEKPLFADAGDEEENK